MVRCSVVGQPYQVYSSRWSSQTKENAVLIAFLPWSNTKESRCWRFREGSKNGKHGFGRCVKLGKRFHLQSSFCTRLATQYIAVYSLQIVSQLTGYCIYAGIPCYVMELIGPPVWILAITRLVWVLSEQPVAEHWGQDQSMKLLMLICKQKRGQIKLKGFKLTDMMHVYSQEV